GEHRPIAGDDDVIARTAVDPRVADAGLDDVVPVAAADDGVLLERLRRRLAPRSRGVLLAVAEERDAHRLGVAGAHHHAARAAREVTELRWWWWAVGGGREVEQGDVDDGERERDRERTESDLEIELEEHVDPPRHAEETDRVVQRRVQELAEAELAVVVRVVP